MLHLILKRPNSRIEICRFGLDWLLRVRVMREHQHLQVNFRPSDVQVGRLMLAFSAIGLDMRIWELLLLRIDSCVPPFTPLLASEGCLCCFKSTAKYWFTVQLRHFLLISDWTYRGKSYVIFMYINLQVLCERLSLLRSWQLNTLICSQF